MKTEKKSITGSSHAPKCAAFSNSSPVSAPLDIPPLISGVAVELVPEEVADEVGDG